MARSCSPDGCGLPTAIRCWCASSTFSKASRGGMPASRDWISVGSRANARSSAAGEHDAELLGCGPQDSEELEILARALEHCGGLSGAELGPRAEGGDTPEALGARGGKLRGRALGQADDQAVEVLGRPGEGDELRRCPQHGLDRILCVTGARHSEQQREDEAVHVGLLVRFTGT